MPWLGLNVPKGRIAWYKAGNKFEARCKDPRHRKCALTRSANPGIKSTGRPMGLMLAWLAADVPTHGDHTAFAVELDSESGRAQRLAARAAWTANPDAIRVSQKERKPRPGEGEEP